MKVEVAGFTFETDPANRWVLIEVVDQVSDHYVVRSYLDLPTSGLYIGHLSWQLDDYTGQALADDTLPPGAPVLAQWTSLGGLTVDGVRPIPTRHRPRQVCRRRVTNS